MSAKDRADSKRPHKVLTLDGGGIRGAMTVEVLARIESLAVQGPYWQRVYHWVGVLISCVNSMKNTVNRCLIKHPLSNGFAINTMMSLWPNSCKKKLVPMSPSIAIV